MCVDNLNEFVSGLTHFIEWMNILKDKNTSRSMTYRFIVNRSLHRRARRDKIIFFFSLAFHIQLWWIL